MELLHEQSATGATDIDILEARAYLATVSGALCLEKRKWEQCLHDYAIARVIYTALGQREKKDSFRDLLTGTVDPSLRYAAYQMKLPRSKPTSSLAIEFFPADSEIRAEVEKIDPSCLAEEAAGTRRTAEGEVQQLPESVTWRSRTVPLDDASISQALAAASAAETGLSSWLAGTGKSASAKDRAAAYDNVIIASQDAVDATKSAIDDLTSEGVDPGDKRLQALQITRTAVNYSLVGWRVGRNRVLCGEQDGLTFEEESTAQGGKVTKHSASNGKKLNRLRERVVLYDSTLQSLDFILELPGVAADTAFVQDLEAKRRYFRALRYGSLSYKRFLTYITNAFPAQVPRVGSIPRRSWQAHRSPCPLRSSIRSRQHRHSADFRQVRGSAPARCLARPGKQLGIYSAWTCCPVSRTRDTGALGGRVWHQPAAPVG